MNGGVILPDIKVKPKNEFKIKKFDSVSVYRQKLKSNLVSINEKTNDFKSANDNSEVDYGANQIEEKSQFIADKSVRAFNKYGKKFAIKTKENIQNAKNKIKKRIEKKKLIKTKEQVNKTKKRIRKTERKTRKTIKNAPKRIKQAGKYTRKTVKLSIKIAKQSYKIAKMTAKTAIKVTKLTIKAVIAAIKAIISATEALIAAIMAGGWVAVLIIVIVCLIAMICSSIYGIFFSNEDGVNDKSMSSVISETNIEFTNKITEIQNNNAHDDYEINSNRVEWKDIIALYAVSIASGKEQCDTITLDDKKIQRLKEIFWEMNEINYRIEDVEKDIEIIDDNGNTQTEKAIRKVLYLDIKGKSVEEMISTYNFNQNQIKQLEELRSDKYKSLWSNVLYGATGGNTDIVQVAFSQLGNQGGQPYWSWYGFNSRVSWCACFVSWCANQCGYIDSGIIPKFAACQNEGIVWFKTCGLWQENGYIPKAGEIIFFDWENDGHSDHVGIVEKVENGQVYTIEGNSNDSCAERHYDINSNVIVGYGTPMY